MRETAVVENKQAVAWSVLLTAFATFLVVAVGGPWVTLRFVRTSTVAQEATVERRAGTPLIVLGSVMVLDTSHPVIRVPEGARVTTEAGDRAIVRLFDDSTLSLDEHTHVELRRLRRPRFPSWSDVGPQVDLNMPLVAGRMADLSVGTTWLEREVFAVRTPHGIVRIAPDSGARVQLDETGLRVVSQVGEVTVSAAGRTVNLGPDERTAVPAGGPPGPPVPALENIVTTPGFGAPGEPASTAGWEFTVDQYGRPGGNEGESGAVRETDGRSTVFFRRTESGGRSADQRYSQSLVDAAFGLSEVADATFVGITATLRVVSQSLPGGGIQSSEYPVKINLIGVTAEGQQVRWTWGFYSVPPADADPTPANGSLVPAGEWLTFESGNLLDPSNPYSLMQQGQARPAGLVRLEVMASGHDYESAVDHVGVWVK